MTANPPAIKRRAYRYDLEEVVDTEARSLPITCSRVGCDRPLSEEGVVVARSRWHGPRLILGSVYCSGECAFQHSIRYNQSENGKREPDQWTLARWSRSELGSERIVLENGYDRRWYRNHMVDAPP